MTLYERSRFNIQTAGSRCQQLHQSGFLLCRLVHLADGLANGATPAHCLVLAALMSPMIPVTRRLPQPTSPLWLATAEALSDSSQASLALSALCRAVTPSPSTDDMVSTNVADQPIHHGALAFLVLDGRGDPQKIIASTGKIACKCVGGFSKTVDQRKRQPRLRSSTSVQLIGPAGRLVLSSTMSSTSLSLTCQGLYSPDRMRAARQHSAVTF